MQISIIVVKTEDDNLYQLPEFWDKKILLLHCLFVFLLHTKPVNIIGQKNKCGNVMKEEDYTDSGTAILGRNSWQALLNITTNNK